MKLGRSPAAFLEFTPAAALAGFVAPHLWLHGFSDRALVDCDPEWYPVSVDGHNGVEYLSQLHPGDKAVGPHLGVNVFAALMCDRLPVGGELAGVDSNPGVMLLKCRMIRLSTRLS